MNARARTARRIIRDHRKRPRLILHTRRDKLLTKDGKRVGSIHSFWQCARCKANVNEDTRNWRDAPPVCAYGSAE